MPAAPDTAALPSDPDPALPPAAAGGPAQSCAGRVLSLLRKLIAYGEELARTVQQQAAAATLFTVAVHFGTKDIALILARITRGLRLANALEARLISRHARPDSAGGLVPAPDPAPVPAPFRVLADDAGRAARRTAPRRALPDMPTAEEIAAALRHRPAAAVIADICRDLGIVPAHPLWEEVMVVLSLHGGNFMKLLNDVMDRVFSWPAAADAGRWPAPRPYPAAACGTGPPGMPA